MELEKFVPYVDPSDLTYLGNGVYSQKPILRLKHEGEMIDISDHLPLYIQVASTLRERIDAGEFAPHTPLPSEPELIEIYKVSRATIRSALDFLKKEGRIYRQHGKGTFVCDPVSRCP